MRLKPRINPWVDKEIRILMYERDCVKLEADTKQCPTLYSDFKKLKNKVNIMIRKSRENYFNEGFSEAGNDARKKSKLVKRMLDQDIVQKIPNELNADKFNEFFTCIGKKTVAHLEDTHTSQNWKLGKSLHRFEFQEIDFRDILKLLKSLGADSSNDVLDMDTKLLSLSANILTPFLLKIFNISLAHGIVLEDWKISRVTPIYKGKGDKVNETNYRPISVIGHIPKILEKIVKNQLMDYLMKNDLICLDQSAYRKYHNTQTSMHKVVEDWLDACEDKLLTGLCLLDISKCFDTIDHTILLEKMKHYGITETENRWFYSYLEERKQFVVCNNKSSKILNVNIGVPQGSVLGPILFLLYVNDLSSNVHIGQCNIYADDTIIYTTGNDISSVNSKLQACVEKASNWYDENKLVVNASKSNVMIVGTPHMVSKLNEERSQLNLSLKDTKLDQVKTCTYLGMNIDDTLSWESQINKLCKTLGLKIKEIKKGRSLKLSQSILREIYLTKMQPIIDYGITIWGAVPKYKLDKIQRLQNFAARYITNKWDYREYRGLELVKSINIMNVEERLHYFENLLMYKCMKDLAPPYLSNQIIKQTDISKRITRSSNQNNLYYQRTKGMKRNSIFIRGAKEWNNLPQEVKSSKSIDNFKVNLKSHMSVI